MPEGMPTLPASISIYNHLFKVGVSYSSDLSSPSLHYLSPANRAFLRPFSTYLDFWQF
jgi:hypothetical protein